GLDAPLVGSAHGPGRRGGVPARGRRRPGPGGGRAGAGGGARRPDARRHGARVRPAHARRRARRTPRLPPVRPARRPRRARVRAPRRGVTVPHADLVAAPLEVVGRIRAASNATFLARVGDVPVVYKPVAGERPLWDFPEGTLAGREVAAYLVSESTGWGIVPRAWRRGGRHGPGHGRLSRGGGGGAAPGGRA